MVAFGTKRTCLSWQSMSAFGGKAEIRWTSALFPGHLAQRVGRPVASRSSTIKLYHGLAKPNASERIRHWSVNRKHCELESVAGLDFGAKHHAIGHVEALNGSRAGIAAPARQLAIDPDLRIIVDQDVEHRHGRLTQVEIADPRWHGQQPAEPHEGGMATTAAHT